MAIQLTGGSANQPTAPLIQFGWGRNDGWFNASLEDFGERVISSPSLASNIIEKDRVNDVFEAGEIARDYFIAVETEPRPKGSPIPSVSVSPASRVSVENLVVKSKLNGPAVITLTTPQRTVSIPFEAQVRETGEDAVVFKDFVLGTAANALEKAVNTRIAGATTAMLPIFTDYYSSNSSGEYTRNPACWAYDLRDEMSCISPWNSNAGNRKAGVAITPRHIVVAAHYAYPVGTQVRFVTGDNQTIVRTVIGRKRHPEYGTQFRFYPDIVVYLLDADLPVEIKPCKILPADFSDYLNSGRFIAGLCLDQEEKALVSDVRELNNTNAAFMIPNKPSEVVLHESKIVGDSGNPAFLIVGGELACLTTWTSGGGGNGTFLTRHIPVINQMIDTLDNEAGVNTGYTLTTVDLSAWPNFNTGNYLIEDNDIANGNAFAWVEDGVVNGKMSYKMRESVNDGWLLSWTGSQWETSDFGSPSTGHPDATSSDDVATPDLATFSTLNFETP